MYGLRGLRITLAIHATAVVEHDRNNGLVPSFRVPGDSVRMYSNTWRAEKYSLGLPKNQLAPMRHDGHGGRSSSRFQGKSTADETRFGRWRLKPMFCRCQGAMEPSLIHGYRGPR
jgi:hypothetical protein